MDLMSNDKLKSLRKKKKERWEEIQWNFLSRYLLFSNKKGRIFIAKLLRKKHFSASKISGLSKIVFCRYCRWIFFVNLRDDTCITKNVLEQKGQLKRFSNAKYATNEKFHFMNRSQGNQRGTKSYFSKSWSKFVDFFRVSNQHCK